MRLYEMKIFTINELENASNSGYHNALTNISQRRQEDFTDSYSYEVVSTLEKITEKFHMTLRDYSIGLFSHSYVRIDTDYYMDLDNESKNELVDWLNDNMEEGKKGSCPFTGVIYDCYFFDEVINLVGFDGVTYNNLHSVVPQAMANALKSIINDEENTVLDDKYNHEYAEEMDLEFTENGEIFND